METYMSATTLPAFTFEGSNVRVFMINNEPWFAATDVARCLGIKDPKDAVKNLRSCERSGFKPERGGSLTILSESGMYTMVLRSDAAIKEGTAAFRFRVWVTDEVLPAIRKQGRYECPAAPHIPPAYLTLEHQYAIQSEVAKRVHKDGVRYQTVYQALKARFRVPKYTCILDRDFEAAVHFIRTCNLRVPEVPEQKPEPQVKTYTVTETFLERVRAFVYYWRYLHRDDLERFLCLMQSLNSPYAAQFAEAIKNLNLILLEGNLEQLGFPVKELPAYKTLMESK